MIINRAGTAANRFDCRARRRLSVPALVLHLAVVSALSAAEPVVAPRPVGQAVSPGITWHTTDRWPNLAPVNFRLSDLPGQSFMIIFPEWLTSRQQSWHVRPTWKTRESGATAEWKTDGASLSLVVRFAHESGIRRLDWRYTVRNLSDRPLDDVAVFNCFNLVDAPAFQDLTMERTWVGDGRGSRTPLASVMRVKAPRTIQFYPGQGGLKLTEFERFSRYQATSSQELSGDRIGVRSRDGKWTVESVVDGQVAYFFNNWEPDHGCIHAAPLLGRIEPGKTAVAKGSLVFRRKSAR